jgi:hypothetical protein
MYDTDLSFGFREDIFYSIGKAIEVICGCNKDVLYASGLHVGEYIHPKGSRFVLA